KAHYPWHGTPSGKSAARFVASYGHSPRVIRAGSPGAATADFVRSRAVGGDAVATRRSAAEFDAAESGDRAAVAQPGRTHEAAPADLRSRQSAVSALPDAGGVHSEVRTDRAGLSGRG